MTPCHPVCGFVCLSPRALTGDAVPSSPWAQLTSLGLHYLQRITQLDTVSWQQLPWPVTGHHFPLIFTREDTDQVCDGLSPHLFLCGCLRNGPTSPLNPNSNVSIRSLCQPDVCISLHLSLEPSSDCHSSMEDSVNTSFTSDI